MTHTKIALAAVTVLALAACDSTITGNEGNLTFTYDADDDVLDFNKPIAIGASLDIRVAEVGTNTPVTLTAASSDDETVIEVADFAEAKLTLTGVGDGNVEISVEADTEDGTVMTDSVNMNSRAPEVHKLSHTCADGGAYMSGMAVYVPFEFEMSNGQAVIGYGYYPVVSSDETKLKRDAEFQGQQYMRYDTLAAGDVTLTSDIDGSVLELTIADEAQIDGIADPIPFVLEDIDVGDTNPFYVLPTVAGETVCQANATIAVTSDSPTICTVELTSDAVAAGTAQYETGWFEVTGVMEGTCTYTVTYPAGSAGAGTSAQFTYPIEP
ncbi:MAG: hypothetical protein KC912_12915 [Proteobacteria bacterium]|nr:hypothetical protein [Pseudomonadota bacterium]